MSKIIEKSVLEFENDSKARPFAPPKPQHLFVYQSNHQLANWMKMGLPLYQKSNDSWSISETMITESNKLSYTSPQTVLPVDHKIKSNIETVRSRVRRAVTELEMIAPKLKPQKTNEQICHVGTRECYNNNPRNIHDPYGYGPTGIQSNKGLSQNPPDLQHCFNSLCVDNKFCHWLEQG
ncbi:hypothetical protein BY996DRAFT_6567240 [Phakopsora pachyrhizi]|nr:hypothetical protein BY996DRAFT_6567240 [Phakopsora pachyrhizi]